MGPRGQFEHPNTLVDVGFAGDLVPIHVAQDAGLFGTPLRGLSVEDPGIDAVAIVTPVHTHFDLARETLRAGKHTFIEKPMAASVAECRELLEIAEERSLTLMVGHTSPATIRAVSSAAARPTSKRSTCGWVR